MQRATRLWAASRRAREASGDDAHAAGLARGARMRQWPVETDQRAATLLQANLRGMSSRRMYAAERDERAEAALKLQAAERGRQGRADFRAQLESETAAAAKLQAVSRGHLARSSGSLRSCEGTTEPEIELAGASPDDRRNSQLVLLVGDSSDGPSSTDELCAFGAQLAARMHGVLLTMSNLVATASEEAGSGGGELKALIAAGKLIPAGTQATLLRRGCDTFPPPHFVIGFPRMSAHLSLLEAETGRVAAAVRLQAPSKGSEDRMVVALLKPLRIDGRVVDIVSGEDAVETAAAELIAAGVAEGLPPTEGDGVAREEVTTAPAACASQVVLVAGANDDVKDDFCAALVAKYGGSVLNMNAIAEAASEVETPEGQRLLETLQARVTAWWPPCNRHVTAM